MAKPDAKTETSDQVYISLAPEQDPSLQAIVDEVRHLLQLPARSREVKVVYGPSASGRGELAILSRSILGVLSQLAVQAEVPAADVALGYTRASIGDIGIEQRPIVIIHSGVEEPKNPFTAVEYNQQWFWIENGDFDSKLAFTVVSILLALAKTTAAPGAIVTIPAG